MPEPLDYEKTSTRPPRDLLRGWLGYAMFLVTLVALFVGGIVIAAMFSIVRDIIAN